MLHVKQDWPFVRNTARDFFISSDRVFYVSFNATELSAQSPTVRQQGWALHKIKLFFMVSRQPLYICVCSALTWRAWMCFDLDIVSLPKSHRVWPRCRHFSPHTPFPVSLFPCLPSFPFPFLRPFHSSFHLLSRLLPITQSLPLFVTSSSSSSPYLAPCSPNPPVLALSWIKLSPILSLYGRIYSSTLSYPPFSTLTVASTVIGLCSLESKKSSCPTEGNPWRNQRVSDKLPMNWKS